MATLLQSIQTLIENITVTDRQEENISSSVNNITSTLDKDDALYLKESFLNGSYERDTIIRPLHDIDIFAVLNEDIRFNDQVLTYYYFTNYDYNCPQFKHLSYL